MKTIEDLVAHGLLRLDVYVSGKKVALLSKENGEYVLTYLPDAEPGDFVSVSMPVRSKSWTSPVLFPFFEMNLPEGVRRTIIAETFGKALCADDISLLALSGHDAIGRVRCVPAGFPLDWRGPCIANIGPGDDTEAFFATAISKFAAQGVSGVQPKILMTNDRVTLKTDRWIIKHDGVDCAGLSINEFLSMTAARRAGLDVPECSLSEDGKSLFVERFDAPGTAFEDFCSLFALPATGKYSGSMERMLRVIKNVVTDGGDRAAACETIVRSHILNVCIGNSDAHLKNFGILTEAGKTRLAPIYDVVSVRAFEDFRRDIPSLMIGGKKEWVIGKAFNRFALQAGISPARLSAIIGDVERAVRETMPDVVRLAARYPAFKEVAKHMLANWDTGLRRIRGEKIDANDNRVLSMLGFSAPQPFKPQRKVIRPENSLTSPGF